MFGGKPLSKGEVVFVPQNGKDGLPRRIASSVIDAEGRYSLSTFVKDDGAMPGEYVVTVVRPRTKSGIDADDGLPKPKEPFVPERYSRDDQTPLKATITGDSSQLQLDFQLDEK